MEPFAHHNFNIYVGTVRGALANTQCKTNTPPLYNFGEEKSEITALEWGNVDEEIIVGYKSGAVKLYNHSHDKFTKTFSNLQGKGAVVGIGIIPKTVVVARQNGVINVCKKKDVDTLVLNLSDESTLSCMTQNCFNANIIGIGGEKNDFKLFDVSTKECIFKAKSLGHDELNLPIPTSIRSISFLENDSNMACCATREGSVLLYDGRAQRKPVGKFTESRASYSVIASTFKEKQCVVGTTKGYIQLIDLRSPAKCVRTYKSFTGGITSIVCDPVVPYVFSTSLDRHLRIHNLDSKELLYKKYMKQSLTKILIKRIVKEESDIKDTGEEVEESVEDQEYEDLFKNMEVISDKKKKRKSLDPSIIKSVKKKKSLE